MKATDAQLPARVAVRDLLREEGAAWGLELVGGRTGVGRLVKEPRVQKPGLALAGYVRQIHPDRIQVIGNPELSYLRSRAPATARRALERLCRERIACLIVTNGAEPPAILIQAANAYRVPLLRTALRSGVLIRAVTGWLEDKLAPRTTVHGVLVQVFGLGVLIVGKSGVGKSEAALDLVSRGHQLVADDVVEVAEVSPLALRGRCPDVVQHHMEIRGLGIINVRELFGTLATLDQQQIDLAVELIAGEAGAAAEQLGIDENRYSLGHVAVPLVRLPVSPGRNLAILIEVAARNQILKSRGHFAAREFTTRLDRRLRPPRSRRVA
jgi:HPr kinase/phosphorylase